ncbi:MAG: hypothetical protein P1V51_24305 [Deltaproteobacteria bacterium]|nr:hypothetical protein [Deltaproteobacteria bacterium]
MRPEALLALLLAGSTACTGYDASLSLTLEGSEALGLSGGGGYAIELLGPNGETLEGLVPAFLPYAEGEQSAGVTVRSFEPEATVFPEGESEAPLILRVEARRRPDGPAIAIGVSRVRVRRHRPVSVTLELHPDPRPLGQGFELRYATDWAAHAAGDLTTTGSSVAVHASPAAPEGEAFHAWLCEPSCATAPPRWLGEVEAGLDGGQPQLLRVDDGEPLIARELELALSSEAIDLGEGSLARPLGFVVASGQLEATRREALARLLTTREESSGGQLQTLPADAPRLPEMLGVAATHAGFAATPGRDDAYIQSHTGHVFWTLGSGTPGPATLPTHSPLPDDTDPRGLLSEGGVQGRLTRLDLEATAAAELSTSPEVAAAALDLAGHLGSVRGSACEAWAWGLYILMGSCTALPPPECGALDCATLLAGAPDLPTAARSQLTAAEAALAAIATLPDGAAGDPVQDAIERMSLFPATAADAGP